MVWWLVELVGGLCGPLGRAYPLRGSPLRRGCVAASRSKGFLGFCQSLIYEGVVDGGVEFLEGFEEWIVWGVEWFCLVLPVAFEEFA